MSFLLYYSYYPVVVTLIYLLVNTSYFCHAGVIQCFDNSNLCFQAAPSSSNNNVDILIATKVTTGWVAIGVGSAMDNSDVMMLWRNSTGDWVVSRRFATGYSRPDAAPIPLQNVVIINSTKTPDTNGYYQILLRRPIKQSSSNAADRSITTSSMTMGYAIYQGSSSVSTTNFPQHSSAGSFQYSDALDSSTSITFGSPIQGIDSSSGSSSSNRSIILLLHGLCMGVAWSALSFISIFTARFMKSKLNKTWFPIHRALFALTLFLTLCGFILVIITNKGLQFGSVHSVLGFIIVIVTFLQIGLGIFIDKTFDPTRSGIPLRDRLHWFTGYFLAIAAPINVILGHLIRGSSLTWLIINIIVFVGFIALFAYGQIRIGQVHEHDLARKSVPGHHTDSTSSPSVLELSNDRLPNTHR